MDTTARLALGRSQAERVKAVRAMNLGAMAGGLASSPVYQQALQVACADPRVVAALGEPIQAGARVTGSIERKNLEGRAELVIPLSGSRKRGTLYVSARQNQDVWQFYTLEVKVAGEAEPILLGR